MTTETLARQKVAKGKTESATATRQGATATKPSASQRISEETRRGMIAEAAFYRALERNFHGGSETEDWLQAEREVDAQLGSKVTH